MVEVNNRVCEFPGYLMRGRFEGSTAGRFSAEHTEEGMVDVMSKKCAQPGCCTYPSHNYPEKRGSPTHELTGMMNELQRKKQSGRAS